MADNEEKTKKPEDMTEPELEAELKRLWEGLTPEEKIMILQMYDPNRNN